MSDRTLLLRLVGITKSFGGLVANEYDSLCVPLDTPVIGGERGSAEYEGELAAARVQYVATQRMREAREEFSKELQSASTEIVNLLHKSIEK
jgi:hypothetical protein